MIELHVGSGSTRGALTVFPIWGETAGAATSTDLRSVRIGELESGPQVETLALTNLSPEFVLVFEGQVLEGGWQTRMVARSTMIAPGGTAPVDVVCVEQGRWGGGRAHRGAGRRASARVRGGLRRRHDDHHERQDAVWSRVAEYDGRHGTSATRSYAELADRAGARVRDLTAGLKPLPGQLGVALAVAGQPVSLEVFDTPRTLRRQFRSVVEATAIDAIGLPEVRTPSRRVRRLMEAARRVRTETVFIPEMGDPRIGISSTGRSEHADVTTLEWGEQTLHLVVTNPKHPLNA